MKALSQAFTIEWLDGWPINQSTTSSTSSSSINHRPTPRPPSVEQPLEQPAFGSANLTNCERELIHLAASIQPHGVLLVVGESSQLIDQAGSFQVKASVKPQFCSRKMCSGSSW